MKNAYMPRAPLYIERASTAHAGPIKESTNFSINRNANQMFVDLRAKLGDHAYKRWSEDAP